MRIVKDVEHRIANMIDHIAWRICDDDWNPVLVEIGRTRTQILMPDGTPNPESRSATSFLNVQRFNYVLKILAAGGFPRPEGTVKVMMEVLQMGCFLWHPGRDDEAVLLRAEAGLSSHEVLAAVDAFEQRRAAGGAARRKAGEEERNG